MDAIRSCRFGICLLLLGSLSGVSPVPDDECPDAFPAHENCDYDEVCEDSSCQYNQYATCHLNRCGTCEAVYSGYEPLTVHCDQLTPKCRLMHLEMLHRSRTFRGPAGLSKVESDNMYDPECEESGAFKPKQCEDDSSVCWCVDSAGVRVTDKTGEDPKCEKLVSVRLIQIHFSFRADASLLTGKEEAVRRTLISKVSRFLLKTPRILQVTVHELSHEVTMKLFSTNGTKPPMDIATVAYYIEWELKLSGFSLPLDGRTLEVDVESIRVFFFDNEPPRINMKSISPGFAAIIIIIISLAILTGIAVFAVLQRRAEQEHGQFDVIEGQELEHYQPARRDGPSYDHS
ncbi:LOW QUALITY PROTEIN: epithelial cell adhesion molecule-like [Anomaloglossus baeobatrachus]